MNKSKSKYFFVKPVSNFEISACIKFISYTFFIILFSFSILYPQNLFSTNNDPNLRKVRLRLKWKHQFQFAGYYAAIEKGYYKNVGLQVELIEADGTQSSDDAVFIDKVEFGVCASDIVFMRSNGRNAVVLASIFQHSPEVIVASRKSGIEHVHDLAGKSLMLEPNVADIITYMNDEGVTLNKCKIRKHSFDVNQLIGGEVDAITAYTTDEVFLLKQANFDYSLITPSSGGIDFYGDVLFTSDELIRKDPELVENFLAASLKGWKYAMENQEELVNIIYEKYSKRHSKEHLLFEAQQMKRYIMSNVVEIGYSNQGRWENILETYRKLGIIKNEVSTNGLIYADYKKTSNNIPWKLIAIFSIVILIITSATIFYYNLSQKLKNEINEREKIQITLTENEKRLIELNAVINHEISIHKQTEEALRISNENFTNIFNTAPFPIAVTAPGGSTIIHANQKAIDLYEIPNERINELKASELFCDESEVAKIQELLHKNGQVDDYEIKVKSLSGKIYWVVFSARKFYYNGKITLLNSQHNITERKATEEALQISENKLRMLNATKDKFFSIIAHDLRGHIGSLSSLLDFLTENKSNVTDIQLAQYLILLKNSAKTTYGLLDNLLTWARSQRGEIQYKPLKTNLYQLINSNIELFSPQAEKKKISFVKNVATELFFYFDYDMINTVLRNLINNAVKYTGENGVITVSVFERNDSVEVRIKDTGIGISEKTVKKLFKIDEKTVSIEGTKGEIGSGLGLILCKEFIEKHSGEIWAESKIDAGSEFVFVLPKQNKNL